MNPSYLLDHFDRVSEAPDAIPRLRRFILDLAVRGKLVKQDLTDEPATVLMKNSVVKMRRLRVSTGTTNPAEFEPPKEVPFDIPQHWIWVRLGDICSKTGSGSTPRGGKSVYQRTGVPFLRSQNVHDDRLRLDDVAYIGPQTHEKMSGTAVQPGDLLLNITGGSIGRCCLVPADLGQANVSQHVAIIRVAADGIQHYLHRLILSPYFQSLVLSEQTGAGRGGLPKNRMDRIPVALPPRAEQQRILIRVNELMVLCDRLQDAREERRTQRNRLTSASHHFLNNGSDPNALRKYTHFFIKHIPHLTVRPEQIPSLRRTILNLAVSGQLVPQSQDDESASALLSRIHEARKLLVNAGKLRKERPPSEVVPKDPPFTLPERWAWARLGDVIRLLSGQHLQPGEYSDQDSNGLPYITGPADFGKSGLTITRYAIVKKAIARKGQILLTVKGAGVGKTAICDLPEVAISRQLMAMSAIEWNQRFLLLTTYRLADTLKESARSLIPGIGREDVDQFIFGLPPAAEQCRIVAKVDDLMALCDRLEAQLATARTDNDDLLDTVLYHALQPFMSDAQNKKVV